MTVGFVAAREGPEGMAARTTQEEAVPSANPDAIDIDDE